MLYAARGLFTCYSISSSNFFIISADGFCPLNSLPRPFSDIDDRTTFMCRTQYSLYIISFTNTTNFLCQTSFYNSLTAYKYLFAQLNGSNGRMGCNNELCLLFSRVDHSRDCCIYAERPIFQHKLSSTLFILNYCL